MLLYVKHFAQMCNRLWALTPVLAYALHKQQKLYVLFPRKEYVECFPNLKRSKYIKFLFSHDSSSPLSLEWRLASLSEKCNLEVKGDLKNVTDVRKFSFFNGWQHSSDISYIAEHKQEIIKLFKPNEQVVNNVKSYFDDYDGMTIGLHIRRGDYNNYLGGKYFFTDGVYRDIIGSLRGKVDVDGKRVRFLICSNDSTTIPDECNDVFSIQGANGITDLYALSCCDYIIGPPSSFSQWASFYGNVPLYVLLNDKPDVEMSLFSRIVTFNKFENGKRLVLDEKRQEYDII